MNKSWKLHLLIAVLISFSAACAGNQQTQASKMADDANRKLAEAKALLVKTDARNRSLFGANIQTVAQFKDFQNKMQGEAHEIAESYEKAGTLLKEAAKQYDDISRLNVDEPFQKYTRLKADELGRRADAVDIRKANARAFIDIADPQTMSARLDENNNRSSKLFSEADELGERAEKIENDNPGLFAKAGR